MGLVGCVERVAGLTEFDQAFELLSFGLRVLTALRS